jgi:hypothetical protein
MTATTKAATDNGTLASNETLRAIGRPASERSISLESVTGNKIAQTTGATIVAARKRLEGKVFVFMFAGFCLGTPVVRGPRLTRLPPLEATR